MLCYYWQSILRFLFADLVFISNYISMHFCKFWVYDALKILHGVLSQSLTLSEHEIFVRIALLLYYVIYGIKHRCYEISSHPSSCEKSPNDIKCFCSVFNNLINIDSHRKNYKKKKEKNPEPIELSKEGLHRSLFINTIFRALIGLITYYLLHKYMQAIFTFQTFPSLWALTFNFNVHVSQ